MKFLSAQTGREWVSTDPSSAEDEKTRAEKGGHHQRLEQFLTEVLLSENLIVLTGLGTSRCVKDGQGVCLAPTMAELWAAAEAAAGEQFQIVKERVRYATPEEGDNIEVLLSHCQLAEVLQPNLEVAKFIAETEKVIVDKCQFVKDHVALRTHEAFLRKVARRSTRQPRMKLFTTNYDLCFETAASRSRFVVVDGFSHTQPQEFDGSYFSYDFVRREQGREIADYIPNVFHLYKIHGSVDWELKGGQIIKTHSAYKPHLIYPRHSKFESSYDQPFIEMMSRFQMALRQPNTGLLVIGVGFSDHHISQPVMSAIRSNVSLKVAIVSRGVKDSTKSSLREIASFIEANDSRLVLIAAGFEELVMVLPGLVGDTEEEQHRRRLRGFEGGR